MFFEKNSLKKALCKNALCKNEEKREDEKEGTQTIIPLCCDHIPPDGMRKQYDR